jgi:hypothetical protein
MGGTVPLTFFAVGPYRDRFQHIPQSVTLDAAGLSRVAGCPLSSGSFHPSDLAGQIAVIARLIKSTLDA